MMKRVSSSLVFAMLAAAAGGGPDVPGASESPYDFGKLPPFADEPESKTRRPPSARRRRNRKRRGWR